MQSRTRSIVNSLIIAISVLAAAPGGMGWPVTYSFCFQKTDQNNHEEIEGLKTALNSSDEEERHNAALALATIATPAAFSALTSALDDKSSLVRAAAITGIGASGDASYVPLIASHLAGEKEIFVRKTAAYALGRLQGPAATAALVTALRDKMDEVRGAAAVALGQYPDASAVEPLILSLSDKSDFVRASAAQALGINGRSAKAAVPALIALLTSDKNVLAKREAAIALGLIGDRSALPALNQAQMDKDPYLSRAALDAIEMIERADRR